MTEIKDRLNARLAGRYRIDKQIGAGGMAVVFLANDLRHDRQVAIKVVHPELAAVLGAERFLAEIRTTAQLQHPHILPLHDSGEADGLLFYVMPLIEGETLRERLQRDKQLPIEEAVGIAKDIAGGLAYAHRHGVIHRDVKPENIFLHEGQALIADFGIALAVTSAGGERMTQTGMSLGTPEYMSPEQALGERSITARADVYALGCVLYEMLTGEPPFRGATVQAIAGKVLHDEPRPPSAFRPSIPAALNNAVLAALAKLPADRIQSATAFAESLSGISAAPATSDHGPQAPARSVSKVWPWQVAAATFAIAAAAGWMRGSPRAGVPYTGPKGCEASDGVWRHVSADRSGMWITHNGYGLEVFVRNGSKVPETSSWRFVRCTDTTVTVVYLGSTLSSSEAPMLKAGNEVTGPQRIVEGVMIWRNPDQVGKLGPELRGERIR